MEKFTNILNRMKLHMEKYKEETLKIEKSSLKPYTSVSCKSMYRLIFAIVFEKISKIY
uniref:Uncharacterized protein n=1 Tax=Ciona intestinalis TaxID=7719 RepID=H2Y3P4_CIOIN